MSFTRRVNRLLTLRRLWRHPRMARSKLLDYQNARLAEVLNIAATKVPLYRRHFEEAGVEPRRIASARDLVDIPITTKKFMSSAPYDDRIDSDLVGKRLIKNRTSGSSTGERFEFSRSLFEERLLRLFRMRAFRQYGRRARDHFALVVGFFPHRNHSLSRLRRWRHRFGLYQLTRVSCQRRAPEILEELSQIAPDMIGGYPDALNHLAPYVKSGDYPRIKPRIMTCGGESLTPGMRANIEEGFGTRLYNIYSCYEFGCIAWQCPETDLLHICDDSAVVEILRDGRPVAEGERGEVVVTGLHGHAMPFIRYRLADLATRGPAPCPCGQPFATLRGIQGRLLDYYHLPDGRSLHHFEFSTQVMTASNPWMENYQIRQERSDLILARIVPNRPPTDQELEALVERARKKLGPTTTFRYELCDHIPPEESGKTRRSISLIRSPYADVDWNAL